MGSEHIELTVDRDTDVATVTLNRPEALNAFAGSMRDDLLAAIDEAAGSARALVITGKGQAFSSGGDVRVLSALREANDADALRDLIAQGKRVVERLQELPIPSLAAVNGVAAGAGLGLALACDLRVAKTSAHFAASFSRIGLHPDWGVSYFLTRLAGPAAARDLVLTGRLVEAGEALTLGLVNEVCLDEDFSEHVAARARELARSAPLSIRHARRTLRLAETGGLEQVLDEEEEAQLACFRSEDAREGLRAFAEGRPAIFKGE